MEKRWREVYCTSLYCTILYYKASRQLHIDLDTITGEIQRKVYSIPKRERDTDKCKDSTRVQHSGENEFTGFIFRNIGKELLVRSWASEKQLRHWKCNQGCTVISTRKTLEVFAQLLGQLDAWESLFSRHIWLCNPGADAEAAKCCELFLLESGQASF